MGLLDCYAEDECGGEGLLTECDKNLMACVVAEVSCAVSEPIKHFKYSGANAEEAGAWGSARPTFLPPTLESAIVERSPTEKNKTYWGNDERTMAVVHLLKTRADALGLTMRDQIELDGTMMAIYKKWEEFGLGGVGWFVVLNLVPRDHQSDYA